MKSIYLSTENFHIATEQERKEISDELFGRRSGTGRENVTQRH